MTEERERSTESVPAAEPAPAMAPAIEVSHLSHSFKAHRVLDRVSFRAERRSIHGFVGPNGAGKTTTLKILATLIRPQIGRVHIFGTSVSNATAVRHRIGYMPDHLGMYGQMRVFEYLDFFAAAYGQPMQQRDRTVNDVLELTDMKGRKESLIKTLSRGMQQRVALARVLVHDPELLLLDEPASGLDPRARIELMAILRELAGMGKTILISSHILTELTTLCDAVTIIDRGQVKYSGSMTQLLAPEERVQDYEVVLEQRVDQLREKLATAKGVVSVTSSDGEPRYVVRLCLDQLTTGNLLRCVLEHGGNVVEFRRVQRQLDAAFLDLTQPGVGG
jgi:ABC-2 type transport system ATP-binding protein